MIKQYFSIALIVCTVGMLIPTLSQAETIHTQSLTISPEQANKLRHIFPQKNTQIDTSSAPSMVEQSEHIVWQKIPLNIILPVGQERIISFPEDVKFGVNSNLLTDGTLSVQSINGVVYLIAKKSFEPMRIFVLLKSSKEVVLLNLSAQGGASSAPIKIVIPSNVTVNNHATELETISTITPAGLASQSSLDYVALTRFAIQQLYAPKRLLTDTQLTYRVPMHTTRTVELIQGNELIVMPLVSWKSGNLYVTALECRNQLGSLLTLDPRKIRGNWKTATFYPLHHLQPLGNPGDTTSLFLTSDQPFNESLGG